MKKKGILIGVLAVLMLVAFTACEQNPSTPLYGKQVENITVASQPVYIIGYDSTNPAEIKLNVNFNDGSSEQYTGKELQMAVIDAADLKQNQSVKVMYNDVPYYVNIKGTESTGISFDLSTAEASYIVKGQEAALSTVATMSVLYEGGSHSYEKQTLTIGDVSELVKDLKDGASFTITPETMATLDPDSTTEYTGSWTLTYYEDASSVVKVTVSQGDYKIYPVAEYTLSEILENLTVTASDDAGNSITLSSATGTDDETILYGWTFSIEGYADGYSFDSVGSKANLVLVAKKTVSAVTTTYKSEPFTLAVSADSPTEFTVEQKADSKVLYYDGASVSASDFDFKTKLDKWVSGHTYNTSDDPVPTGFDNLTWTNNIGKIPAGLGTAEGATYQPVFTTTLNGKKITAEWGSNNITVYDTEANAKAAQD